ncbi:MAG: hypothetical protein AABW54_01445 [Candidatus Micrarchaeota archaeon]
MKKTSATSEFKDFVKQVSGPAGLKVVNSIGDGATDETIEKNTRLKLSEIRSLLNLLQNYGAVEYNREKNMTTGWFTYTWRINASRALQKKLSNTRNEYLQLCRETADEGAGVYKCPEGCVRLPFEHAFENKFACPKCSRKLKNTDGSKELESLQSKLSALENIIASQLRN